MLNQNYVTLIQKNINLHLINQLERENALSSTEEYDSFYKDPSSNTVTPI